MRIFSGFIISLYSVSVLAAEPQSLNRVNTPSDAALQQGYEEQNRALQRQQEQTSAIQSQQVKQPEVRFQT